MLDKNYETLMKYNKINNMYFEYRAIIKTKGNGDSTSSRIIKSISIVEQ